MKKINEQFSPYLYDYVKRKIDFSEFLSTEIGCNLRWYEPKVSAGTFCPMPNHKDKNASFRLKYMENSGVWIFNCFGCGSKGTIIDFCMDYYGISSSVEAVLFLCNKFGLKKSDISIADSLKDVKKRANLQRKINCAHVVASRQCFSLLQKNYVRHNAWVKEAYKTMNKALDAEDIGIIEGIGFEASEKMQETEDVR
jgi:DNA primase